MEFRLIHILNTLSLASVGSPSYGMRGRLRNERALSRDLGDTFRVRKQAPNVLQCKLRPQLGTFTCMSAVATVYYTAPKIDQPVTSLEIAGTGPDLAPIGTVA